MTYVRQCVDEGIKFAEIIMKNVSNLRKKSHNHLKSPGTYYRKLFFLSYFISLCGSLKFIQSKFNFIF
jgi:hypothetical protein